MVRTRNSNGQFISEKTEKNCWYLAKIMVVLAVSIPLLYHLLIRKELLSWGVDYLNREFGCTCNTTKEPSSLKNGF